MIDLADLRKNPEPYKRACATKRINFEIDAFLALDQDFRSMKAELEALRSKQNTFSKSLSKIAASEREAKMQEMKELSAELRQKEAAFKDVDERWKRDQLLIPAIPLARVPVGKDDSENVEIRKVGEIVTPEFKLKDHVELGESLDILDIERGVKIAGGRSYFLKGDGTRLQHAVLNFGLDLLHKKKYVLMDPPHLVKYDAMQGTSYFPGGEEAAYHLDERDQDFYLIGTAEVSVCSYHQDEILSMSSLPLRYAGYSPCYRREAGTYGKDTRGIYRIHQFYKVEQVIFCRADDEESARMHAELLGNAEELMQLLEIPYRVVDVCTGDLGRGQVYKNDIEAWMPSRNAYGETHSCSTFLDFQSRRLGIRYKDEVGKNTYCHTLNNTLVASPRILIPLLELNQNADGSVNIPKVLQPYMGGQKKIEKKS